MKVDFIFYKFIYFLDLDVDLEDNGEEEEGEETSLATTAKPNDKNSLSFSGDDLESFIKWPEYSHWIAFLRLDNET